MVNINNKVKISIVIPCYNGELYIKRCLDSFVFQNRLFSDLEVIFINDGSSDNSLDVISDYLMYVNVDLRIYSTENRGLSASRNMGLKEATGDYIWFVDVDDVVSPDSLLLFEKILAESEPDIVAFKANRLLNKEVIVLSNFHEIGLQKAEDFFVESNFEVCVPFYLYRREFLIRENLFFMEGIIHEDFEFTPRALLRADKLFALNESLYNVYYTDNSLSRSNNPKKSFDLLKVIESLRNTSQTVSNVRVRRKIYSLIAMGINNSLYNISRMDLDTIKRFKEKFKSYKSYSIYYLKSYNLKYFLEGLIMYISIDLFLFLYFRLK